MSPWSHKEMQVLLSPDQVTLLSVQRTLTWRGLRRTMHDPHRVCCNSAIGAQPWRAAVQALETALSESSGGKTTATVILSNHFLRYAMVPWRAELANAEEDLSFARHCFTRVYGKAALQWEIRLNEQPPEMPRLASAVDAELLDALRGVFNAAGLTLQSVQPHLMAAFNSFRGHLRQRSAWFALLEPGNLCLALLHKGHWSRVRSQRVDSTWREELPLILDREVYLADDTALPHEVYVCHGESADTVLPAIDPWQFHPLPLVPAPGVASAQGENFTMAMEG
ncbi:hypothetical protein [Rhodoferax ferrireducens]|uniref:hypothetical protein n=1 Tax=Rhodoferax ferrireducens TaxID=192843 RepID=UPI0013006A54|nr:hypothetical protein [Rhodoferax ferrireducens]